MIFISCRKDSFITSSDARISLSADTLKFDTVFVTTGSTYRTLKVMNENNQKLKVSLKLSGGNNSFFKLNVDGRSGFQFDNLELNANDSIYLFAQVNVDPTTANLPFILRDSVEVNYNGNKRFVQLEAWGQNAHFFRDKVISTNETWNNDLPYVILGSLQINTNQTLTINKGCRIYIHADAPILVNGTMVVNGLKDSIDRVYFQGDRLDEPYKFFPASWPGIFFGTNSKDNNFSYAVLKNSYQGMVVQNPSSNANAKLTLNECIIDNSYTTGILGYNTKIKARNCLVSNCGQNVLLFKGGDYQFDHCTVVTISNRYIDHRDPVFVMANYETVNNVNIPYPLTALVRNCIFWGENGIVEDEVKVPIITGATVNASFQNCLWKVTTQPTLPSSGIISNQHPQFDSINTFRNYYNFRLKTTNPRSPAIDAGTNTGATLDLDGLSRPRGAAPDMGCYESN
jgi:hypothetical protein